MDKLGFFSYKIPDAGHTFSIAKPFDGFFIGMFKFGCWEGKRINGLSAFNFKQFEPQQLPALLLVNHFGHMALITLFFNIPYKSFCLILDVNLVEGLIKDGILSIVKKDLQKILQYSFPLTKGLFQLNDLKDKIVTLEKWQNRGGI